MRRYWSISRNYRSTGGIGGVGPGSPCQCNPEWIFSILHLFALLLWLMKSANSYIRNGKLGWPRGFLCRLPVAGQRLASMRRTETWSDAPESGMRLWSWLENHFQRISQSQNYCLTSRWWSGSFHDGCGWSWGESTGVWKALFCPSRLRSNLVRWREIHHQWVSQEWWQFIS